MIHISFVRLCRCVHKHISSNCTGNVSIGVNSRTANEPWTWAKVLLFHPWYKWHIHTGQQIFIPPHIPCRRLTFGISMWRFAFPSFHMFKTENVHNTPVLNDSHTFRQIFCFFFRCLLSTRANGKTNSNRNDTEMTHVRLSNNGQQLLNQHSTEKKLWWYR